ncbi:PHP domain protein [Halococcus morrhuae DSM 1307]|uniref:PHP domain protein n=1 Tax=Halococcus morrhuae DSM 1307 TaxID=931277 RepID=M0MNK9_HALMO|nr:CehA/McbA family metallohydrolase [Halococcus morrhuae]EMA46334.1 PHP domain protein [Halococcus morrhuae DSM 1307]
MYRIDLHAHTRFFHGHRRLGDVYDPLGGRLLAGVARARGLDGVATTNHDYYRAFDDEITGVAVLPGIEISTTRGHVLVVGPNPPSETDPGELTPGEVVDIAHERDCAAIIAHPYRNSTVREADAAFDAIEVNGKHPRTREWVERLADQYELPMTGGSDAHYPIEVGRAYTAVDVDDPTPENVVAAIRDGRVEPRVADWLPYRLIGRLYRYIHAEKDQLDAPDWATPGVGTPPEDD